MSSTEEQAFDKLCSKTINGHKTDFVFQKFQNTYFLIITQYQKMVNLYTVKIDNQGMFPGMTLDSLPLTITSNFGADTDEIVTAIKFLVNNSKLKLCETDISISIGLKEINAKCLREICTVLDDILPPQEE